MFSRTRLLKLFKSCKFKSTYIQGQSPEPRIREYFYFIDHQGMLFLDDTKIKNFTSCFKDKKFLSFFFARLRKNDTNRYMKEFPYLSICGRERNFIKCDDLPIVYTQIIQKKDETGQIEDRFCYNHGGDSMTVPFEPKRIFMSARSGRVYHPAAEKLGGVGLVKSSLAIEFSTLFEFENGEECAPTRFRWNDEWHELDTDWFKCKDLERNCKIDL